MNPYDELGVDKDATDQDIKRAFRKRAKGAHPDGGGDPEKFGALCLARDVLMDKDRRDKFDRTGNIDEGMFSLEPAAMNIVMQTIAFVINNIEARRRPVEEFDILGDAVKKLKTDIAGAKSQSKEHEAYAKKHRRLAKRIRAKKDKKDVISTMFEANARMADERAADALKMIPAAERAIEIIEDHEFSYTSRDAYGDPGPTRAIPSFFQT